jgi:cytoskeleton-associated protein 5
VPISEIVEDVLTAAKSKNPQVREGTLKFLLRALQSTTTAPGKDQVKPMAETLVAALGDSVEPVRSAAAECLGTMMKLIGERAFNPYIEGVGEIQMTKVKDAFGKAEIKYRAGGAAKPVAKPAAKPAGVPAVKKVRGLHAKRGPRLTSANAEASRATVFTTHQSVRQVWRR